MKRVPIAIFASGNGSNAQTLIDRAADGTLPIEVCCLVSDRPEAPAVARARRSGVPTIAVGASAIGRDRFEQLVVADLRERGVELVVLAGYMRICGKRFLDEYEGKAINLHPSLLPAFPGRDAIGAALEAGVRQTGVSVHYIDAGVDTGPLIAQRVVEVRSDDTRQSLTERIQRVERQLLPEVVGQLARELIATSRQRATTMAVT